MTIAAPLIVASFFLLKCVIMDAQNKITAIFTISAGWNCKEPTTLIHLLAPLTSTPIGVRTRKIKIIDTPIPINAYFSQR